MAIHTPLRNAARALLAGRPRQALRCLGPSVCARELSPLEFLVAGRALYLLHGYTRMRQLVDRFGHRRARRLGGLFHGHYLYYLAKCHQSEMHLLSARDNLRAAAESFARWGPVREEAEAWLALSDVYRHMRGPAEPLARDALDTARRCIERMPDGKRRGGMLAKHHGHVGRHRLSCGAYADALEHFVSNRRICEELGETDPVMLMHLHEAWCHVELGEPRHCERSLAAVKPGYLRRQRKQALYHRALRARLLALDSDTERAVRVARALWLTLRNTRHNDLLLYLLLARTLRECGGGPLCRDVCRAAIRRIENARRRLHPPEQMREFRETWSGFYQILVMELAGDGDPDVLCYHVMNQSRTLFDLLRIATLGQGDPGRVEPLPRAPLSSLERAEARLKGGHGGAALSGTAVRKAANVVLNALPGARLLLPTWYDGRLVLIDVYHRPGSRRAAVGVCSCACADPRRAAGKVRAQHCFASWLRDTAAGDGAPDAPVIIVPDDLTRGVAFHTAPLDNGTPACVRLPVLYHVSLPALALQCGGPRPRRAKPARVALMDLPGRPGLKARREIRAIADVLGASDGVETTVVSATAEAMSEALRGCDIVHLAGHHYLSPLVDGYSRLGETGEDPITVAGLLQGGRVRAAHVVAAMCRSGDTVSPIFNEPVGFLSALLTRGVRGIVASRAPIDGDESIEWMAEYYRQLTESGLSMPAREAYFRTMRVMYERWASRERVGKFVYYGL